MSEQYLVHYGVQGMRWGVRHDPDRVGSLHRFGSSGGGFISRIRDKRNARRISRFESKNHSSDTLDKITGNMNKRGGSPSLDKAYDKWQRSHGRLQSSYDRQSDNARSARELNDISKKFDIARKAVDQKYQKSVMKEFKSLDTKQKVSIIRETNVQKGAETVGRIAAGGLTVAALIALSKL